MSTASPAHQQFKKHLSVLRTLSQKLPSTVPLATSSGRINEIFAKIPVPGPGNDDEDATVSSVFNRRMDILLEEDIRDANGRLTHISRGEYGMDMVVAYFTSCFESGKLSLGITMVKLERLIKELEILCSTAGGAQPVPDSAPKKRPPKAAIEDYDSDEDETYRPPKRPRGSVSPERQSIFDENGDEIMEDTEMAKELKKKRDEAAQKKAAQKKADQATSKAASKKQPRKSSTKEAKAISEPLIIDSGEESNGLSALKRVEAAQRKPGARRGPENASMSHFHEPIPIHNEQGNLRWEFRCRYCKSTRSIPRTVKWKNVTFDDEPLHPRLNNLATHANECSKKQEAEEKKTDDEGNPITMKTKQSSDIMSAFLEKGKIKPHIEPSQKGFMCIFSAWILDESLPWTTGEAPGLQALFKYLDVRYDLPSDTAVRNQLAEIFISLHKQVVVAFAAVKSKIAFTTDTWTMRQMVYSFACTMASFINEDWELMNYVVDFVALEEKDHEGVHAGRAFAESAICRGCLTLTTDNASVNDVLVQTAAQIMLAHYGINWTPDMHVRCIAHVVSLTTQAFLAAVDEADDEEVTDYYDLHKGEPIHYDVDEDEEQKALEQEEIDRDMEVPKTEEFIFAPEEKKDLQDASALKRLRFITTKIVSSPQRRARFRRIAASVFGEDPKTVQLSKLMVVRDVINQWVSNTGEIDEIQLLRSDWTFLEQLNSVLKLFTEVTQRMSVESTPTIPFVLPLYVNMDDNLTKCSQNSELPYKIHNGAKRALEKLRKYKVQAEDHHFYKLGTILHPSMRTQWFAKLATSKSTDEPQKIAAAHQEMVQKAELLLTEVAMKYIEDTLSAPPSSTVSTPPPAKTDTLKKSRSFLDEACDVDIPESEVTVSEVTAEDLLRDEIRRYVGFQGGRVPLEQSLSWWKVTGHSTS